MGDAVLCFEHVTHRYGSGRPALDDVNLTVTAGEVVALIGPSGAGKSTLLRVINGLVTPTEGAVTVLGSALGALTERERMHLRRQIGMIFQEFALVDRLSVLTNVLIGRLGFVPVLPSLVRRFPHAERERALAALDDVGLPGLGRRLVRQLSGGQKQRVGVARALVQEPTIILGDEPTANLDIRTSDEVLSLLVRLAEERGVTLVLSLHDVRAARRFCKRVLALRDGRVAWDGDPAAFSDQEMERVFY